MATLDLPTDARTAVWRLIRDQLQADPILHEQIATWLVWEGTDDDAKPLADVLPPALRLTPIIGPQKWLDTETRVGSLTIVLEAYISGTDIEDVLNLQGLIESALEPADPDARDTLETALRAAGATTGELDFHDPFLGERPGEFKAEITESGFVLRGACRLDVSRSLTV